MMSATRFEDGDEVRSHVGKEVCVTDWMIIGQERIDLFAQATGDFQWIHVDVERSAKSSPYGGTIAHGFLTLSLLGKFYEDYLGYALPFCDMGINYGLNKVRFTSPVPADSRVQGRFVLSRVEEVTGGLQLTFVVTVAIEGQQKPALIAESLVRRFFKK
ncbi:MAG TPA: MaoC family dehydratase [Casimicrobiaceae bacterium]|nr:MaoC family dehydratase [Casimicrobiaceae bacterium]